MNTWIAKKDDTTIVIVSTGDAEPWRVEQFRILGFSVRKLEPEPKAPPADPIIFISEH